MTTSPQPRVAHPFRLYRKGWVIVRTGVPGERFCSLGWRSTTALLHLPSKPEAI